jgi:nitroimidazol reductase NimA-like FMN-containing flavoprotein (pyridoxamine 5'-phosphate oxidase superfamily)
MTAEDSSAVSSPEPHLVILDREHCLQLLAAHAFGRILYTAGALPAIQPVDYVLDGNHIVIRTDHLPKLAVAGRQEVVAFEIDDIDPDRGSGWSVVVTGHATEIVGGPELTRARALPLSAWSRGASRYLQISCDLVAGRRFHGAEPCQHGILEAAGVPDEEEG